MTRITQQTGQSPFNPVHSFTALACGLERVTLKEPAMFDLVSTIRQSRKTYEAAVSIRGAIVGGGESDALLADLHARFKEQATALGYLIEPIDDAAMAAVEGEGVRDAAE
jgi:hypothetical protein